MVATQAKDRRSGSFLGRLLLGSIILVSAVSCISLLATALTSKEKAAVPLDEQELKRLQSLTADELTVLSGQAIDSLSSAPLNNQAVHRLASIQSLLGKNAEAEELAIESATRTLRDTRSQLAAVMLFFSKKRYAEGLKHLDVVIRSKPALSPEVFTLLKSKQSDPQFREKFAAFLVSNPSWRWNYFFDSISSDKEGQETFQMLTALRLAGGRLTSEEMRHYLAVQISNKNFDLAYFIWLDSLDPVSLQKVADIFDRNFELSPKNMFFDWTLSNYPNARIEVSPESGKPDERHLVIDFFGAGKHFAHVNQYLRLQPGAYDFEVEYQATNFQSPTGLRWSIYCESNPVRLANTPATQKNSGWEKLNFSFNIPAEKCSTQLLQLESSSDAVLDQKYQGKISFDNILVNRKGP